MTPEELAEIRALVQVIDQEDPDASFDAIVNLAIKVPGLLELVDQQKMDLGDLSLEIIQAAIEHQRLQERVRELEQHFSGEANSEYMPTSGDLL